MRAKGTPRKDTFGGRNPKAKPGREGTHYPLGDGDKDCKLCKGRGVVVVPEKERPPFSIGEVTKSCPCTFRRDTLINMERGWRGLTKAGAVKETPLASSLKKNLWITSDMRVLQRHLARLTYSKGRFFNFKVISDVDLMSAWLYSANEVFDADVQAQRHNPDELGDRYSRIEDLVEPWELLVIRLGVKTARNVAAPEVLLEALQIREMLCKVTWIVDTQQYPLSPGHISYDDRVAEFLESWDQLILGEPDPQRKVNPYQRTVEAVKRQARKPDPAPQRVTEKDTEEDLDEADRYAMEFLEQEKAKANRNKRKGYYR